MKMISLLVLFFALSPTSIGTETPGDHVPEHAKEDSSGKSSAEIRSSEHIAAGGGGGRSGSFGSGSGGSRGGGSGSSSGLPRSGRTINPVYVGTAAQNHNTHTHSAAASKRQSSWLGLHGLEFILIFTYLAI